MTYEKLRAEANKRPITADLGPLSEIYFKDFYIYDNKEGFQADLEDPEFLFEKDVVIDSIDGSAQAPFIDADIPCVDENLEKWINWETDRNILEDNLITQSGIKDYIVENHSHKDIVVLIIIDGLSYEKSKILGFESEPVLVDGVSKTKMGYLRTVYGDANTSLAAKLVTEQGFKKSVGFAYWNRDDNDLNQKLNRSITNNEFYNMDRFTDVIDRIREIDNEDEPCYIQITLQGLDQNAHQNFGRPDNQSKIQSIESNIQDLRKEISRKTDSYSILATADHGLIWKDDLKDSAKEVRGDSDQRKPRYMEGVRHCPEEAIIVKDRGKEFGMLPFPYLYRGLHNNEWGIHGGFSYWESIVPLIKIEGD